MVRCPVCNKIVYTKKGIVNQHGTNEALCYGSYMAASHCHYVGPSPESIRKKVGGHVSIKQIKEIMGYE